MSKVLTRDELVEEGRIKTAAYKKKLKEDHIKAAKAMWEEMNQFALAKVGEGVTYDDSAFMFIMLKIQELKYEIGILFRSI